MYLRLATAVRWTVGVSVWAAAVSAAWATDTDVRWQRPGFFFPVLGWREPVNLASATAFDRLFQALPADRYNCHFYTKVFIASQSDAAAVPAMLRHTRADLLTTRFLTTHGYRRVERGGAAGGDVIVAGRRGAQGDDAYTHSAIVEAVDANGRILRIRQKFNAECPVVDVDFEEFVMLYAGMYPWETHLWRRAETPAWDASGTAWATVGP